MELVAFVRITVFEQYKFLLKEVGESQNLAKGNFLFIADCYGPTPQSLESKYEV